MSSKCQIVNTKLTITMNSTICHVERRTTYTFQHYERSLMFIVQTMRVK